MRLQGKVRHNGLPTIQPGNSYILLYHDSDPMHPWMMAYAPDPSGYVLLNLKGEAQAELYKLRKENSVVREMEVAIITDLAEAMFNREFGLSLAREMESALKWKLDFFHLDPGDRFSLLFRETEFEGGVKTIEGLEAVRFRHDGEEGYAFHYQDAYVNGYFDQEGRPMRSGFLQAPLEYGRISSSYNLTRRDPILNNGEIRAHLGTDYAAPTGTPILAVGDGIVLNAENKGGNGNYVKIFHTEKIQTQYLHMSAFAEGIEPGAEVQQGQVIGYVGSTGRATGPHVCFRFWKDGVQVDHRKEKFLGPSPPLRGKSMEMFEQRRDSLMRIFEPV
jgi:murein DD-endopeptidase MepM/ murein hydrolase activator NlpD